MILSSIYNRVIAEWLLPILEAMIAASNEHIIALFHSLAREAIRSAPWRLRA
ncbi:MAG: hypothetical protein WBQ86_09585 [Candidatus Binatus sp.]